MLESQKQKTFRINLGIPSLLLVPLNLVGTVCPFSVSHRIVGPGRKSTALLWDELPPTPESPHSPLPSVSFPQCFWPPLHALPLLSSFCDAAFVDNFSWLQVWTGQHIENLCTGFKCRAKAVVQLPGISLSGLSTSTLPHTSTATTAAAPAPAPATSSKIGSLWVHAQYLSLLDSYFCTPLPLYSWHVAQCRQNSWVPPGPSGKIWLGSSCSTCRHLWLERTLRLSQSTRLRVWKQRVRKAPQESK